MHIIRAFPALLLLVGCATTQQQATNPERWSIEVPLGVLAPEAFKRTMAAFVHEGLVVAQADVGSGVITSVPKTSGSWITHATIYRANILASGDTSSTVVLSGGWSSKDIDQLASNVSGQRAVRDEKPLGSGMAAWKVLEQIATTLRGNTL